MDTVHFSCTSRCSYMYSSSYMYYEWILFVLFLLKEFSLWLVYMYMYTHTPTQQSLHCVCMLDIISFAIFFLTNIWQCSWLNHFYCVCVRYVGMSTCLKTLHYQCHVHVRYIDYLFHHHMSTHNCVFTEMHCQNAINDSCLSR